MLQTILLFNNRVRILLFSALLCVLFAMTTPATTIAEEIRIPIGQQAGDESRVQVPDKGMTKERVKATFGEPIETSEPKGNPPISRWNYNDFVVYFEYDHVIHSVRVFKPKAVPAEN